MSILIKTIVQKNHYLDSIFLMNATNTMMQVDGVKDVVLVMGTEMNKTVLEEAGALTPEANNASANDLVISLDIEDESVAEIALKSFNDLLSFDVKSEDKEISYPSLKYAKDTVPESNLAFISVPGEYAAQEARNAISQGLNTFIFSDNVSLEDEVDLKQQAEGKGLLVMGPGCGTSVINGVSIGMMSSINKGDVGIVGASGSGIHEIAALLDQQGKGITQAIGTGGRDLSKEVGGITMIKGFQYLQQDKRTKVIVLVSKPPHPETARKIFKLVKESTKPVVIFFLGGDTKEIEESGAYCATTLEEAALIAGKLVDNKNIDKGNFIEKCKSELMEMAKEEKSKLNSEQKYIKGLFCGGTHCEEAILMIQDMVDELYSNISFGNSIKLESAKNSIKHSLIDMGDEEFTKGKPHPVMDPSVLKERIIKEGNDPETAVILLDILLGYGAHEDPVSTIEDTIKDLKKKIKEERRYLSIVASLCGTYSDPQNFEKQKDKLENLGVKVLKSNSQAALLSGLIVL